MVCFNYIINEIEKCTSAFGLSSASKTWNVHAKLMHKHLILFEIIFLIEIGMLYQIGIYGLRIFLHQIYLRNMCILRR